MSATRPVSNAFPKHSSTWYGWESACTESVLHTRNSCCPSAHCAAASCKSKNYNRGNGRLRSLGHNRPTDTDGYRTHRLCRRTGPPPEPRSMEYAGERATRADHRQHLYGHLHAGHYRYRCREGDPVTIFGAEPGNTVSDMAAVLKTIPYEIMTSISTRVKRVYTKE